VHVLGERSAYLIKAKALKGGGSGNDTNTSLGAFSNAVVLLEIMKQTAALLFLSISTAVADDFINLTFDNPNLSGTLTPFPGFRNLYTGSTSNLIPGWSFRSESGPISTLLYAPPGFGAGAQLYGTLHENSLADFPPFGKYTFEFSHLFPSSTSPLLTLEQTGTIPAGADGLSVWANGGVYAKINGIQIGLANPSISPITTLDVSAFAGKTVTLSFEVRDYSITRFDILGFTYAPEPSTWALSGVGVSTLLLIARNRKRPR
jgi:hypothetical protein